MSRFHNFSSAVLVLLSGLCSVHAEGPAAVYIPHSPAPPIEYAASSVGCQTCTTHNLTQEPSSMSAYSHSLYRFTKELAHRAVRWPKHYFENPTTPPAGGTGYGYYEPRWVPFEARFASPVVIEKIEEVETIPMAQSN